jgi:tetratricopeptide (TPR) repeat protein
MLEHRNKNKIVYLLIIFVFLLTTNVYSEEKETKKPELKEPLQKKLIDSKNFIKEKKPKKEEVIKSKENSKKITEQEKREADSEWLYREAIRLYKLQSLYSAVDMFVKILRDPTSPYYIDSIFMLGKVYIEICKKTGIKKHIWTAISYLNIYYSKADNIDWDFFYTKGYAYEILGFYDKSLALYKLSLNYIKTIPENVKTTLGILRASVGLKKMDLLTKYLVRVNLEYLKNHDKKELNFIKGAMYFSLGDYQRALKHFIKTYKEFEEYLIENPNFYYIVAETAYRTKQYKFALQLFKRIIKLT